MNTTLATAGSRRQNGFDLEGFVYDVGQVIIEMDMKIKQLEYRLGEESPNVFTLKSDNVRPNLDSDDSMKAEPSYYEEVNEIQPIPPALPQVIPTVRNRLGKLINTHKSRAISIDPTSARVFNYKEGKSGQLLRDTVV